MKNQVYECKFFAKAVIIMDYTVKGTDILVHEPDLDLDETLDCGQAFRWRKTATDYDCTYTGSFINDKLTISQVKAAGWKFTDCSTPNRLRSMSAAAARLRTSAAV